MAVAAVDARGIPIANPNRYEPVGKTFAISNLWPGKWTVKLTKGDRVIVEKAVELRGTETIIRDLGGAIAVFMGWRFSGTITLAPSVPTGRDPLRRRPLGLGGGKRTKSFSSPTFHPKPKHPANSVMGPRNPPYSDLCVLPRNSFGYIYSGERTSGCHLG